MHHGDRLTDDSSSTRNGRASDARWLGTIHDPLTVPSGFRLVPPSVKRDVGNLDEKPWPPIRSKRKHDEASASNLQRKNAKGSSAQTSDNSQEDNVHGRVLAELDSIFEGRLGAITGTGDSSVTSSQHTLAVSESAASSSEEAKLATAPSPTRILLNKIKELGHRVALLELRNEQLGGELAQMKERMDGLARGGAIATERRIDVIEQELRHLTEDTGYLQVGEQTQIELDDMYGDVNAM